LLLKYNTVSKSVTSDSKNQGIFATLLYTIIFMVNFFTTPRNLEASFVMDERKWKPHFKLQGYVTTALTR